jgi:hypothetical protein
VVKHSGWVDYDVLARYGGLGSGGKPTGQSSLAGGYKGGEAWSREVN